MAARVKSVKSAAPTAPSWSWTLEAADSVSSAAWSPDGSRILVGSLSGEALLVDSATGEAVTKCAEHPFGTLDVAWSSDGQLGATVGIDGVVRVVDAAGNERGSNKGPGWASRAVWSPTAPVVAVARGKDLLLVDDSGNVTKQYLAPTTISDLLWSADGSRVAISAYGGVQWFDRSSASPEPTKRMEWKGSVLRMALSSTGTWLCHGNQDNSVHVWRLKSGDEMEMTGYPAKIEVLGFDASGRWLAVGTTGLTTVWDCAGKGPRGRRPVPCEGHTRRVTAVAWRAKTTLLASGSADGTVLVFDPAKGKVALRSLAVGGEVTTLSWSPDGSYLLVGRNDGVLACMTW